MGVRVFGVHKDLTSPAARSRYWTHNLQWDFSLATAQESIDWLLQLAARVGNRPLLIPTDDGSCLFVSDHADALCAAFRFPNQSTGLARRLSSKKLMYLLCREFGMPTAATSFPQSRAEVEAYAPNATFPVMLKGIDTLALQQRTGVKMVVAHDADDLLRRYDELNDPTGEPNLMLQEYLPGGSQTLWMFDGYFDEHSDCLFGMTGQKIREYPAHMPHRLFGRALPGPAGSLPQSFAAPVLNSDL